MDDEVKAILERVDHHAKIDPGGKNIGLNQTLNHTAQLLALLDKRATANADKNLELARSMKKLTCVVIGLTIITFICVVVQTIYTIRSYNLATQQYQAASAP